ncbi:hypothetical protein O181_032169 [Austropuccinia psidii MF-1]|uniref:Uncharacterized protein n=1 Tax=Austropuccinia psidii MF-1 TaxID=1389203 RepID=A0A9Q3CWZ3_9BASI|nr:hypothetical protein [Austropuccinia psidii MF-1]
MYGGLKPYRKFLTHVQGPDASHAIPYTGPGSQCFTCDSLILGRFQTLQTQCLKLVQVPNTSDESPHIQCLTRASHDNPYAQHFTHNSLCWSRFPMLHRPILTPDA